MLFNNDISGICTFYPSRIAKKLSLLDQLAIACIRRLFVSLHDFITHRLVVLCRNGALAASSITDSSLTSTSMEPASQTQSLPFSSFHLFRYLWPLSAPWGSPSNLPLVGGKVLVTKGVNCDRCQRPRYTQCPSYHAYFAFF